MNLLLETYGSDSSSDDEDFVVRAPTPRTTVNGRTHAHLPNLLSYYLLTNPDFAPTERPAKKAKTVVPKVKFADLREDVRANAIQTMPSKLTFEGHQWKCSSRVFSQKDDGWTAYYSCCHKADREGCCDGRIVVKTTRDFRLVVCGIRDIFSF